MPDDISLMGFDDDLISRYMNPPLTTMTNAASGSALKRRVSSSASSGAARFQTRVPFLPSPSRRAKAASSSEGRTNAVPWRWLSSRPLEDTGDGLHVSSITRNETIFALANGSLGIRGGFEEVSPSASKAPISMAFTTRRPSCTARSRMPTPRIARSCSMSPMAIGITLSMGGEMLDLSTGTILAYERCLDLSLGILSREVRWRSPVGREIALRALRLVSFTRPAVAAIEWSIEVTNGGASLLVESSIVGEVANQSSSDDSRIAAVFPIRPFPRSDAAPRGRAGFWSRAHARQNDCSRALSITRWIPLLPLPSRSRRPP